jgi:predicted PurR-regulated permease PerM
MRTLLVAIGFFLVVGIIIYISLPKAEEPSQTEFRNRDEIVELNERIKAYEMTITDLQDSLVIMDSVIKNNTTKIIYIKNQANEKANRVSSYTTKQLNDFLSERYKDSIR